MIKFEKPQYKVTEYVESNSYGKFELEPLEKGFARTRKGRGKVVANKKKV